MQRLLLCCAYQERKTILLVGRPSFVVRSRSTRAYRQSLVICASLSAMSWYDSLLGPVDSITISESSTIL